MGFKTHIYLEMNTIFADPFPFPTCWKDITNSQLWRPLQALFWSSKSGCYLSSYIGGESNNAYDWQFWVICLLKKIVHGFGWCHILTPNQISVAKNFTNFNSRTIFQRKIACQSAKQSKLSEASPQVPTGDRSRDLWEEDIREVQNSDMRIDQWGACGFLQKIRAKYSTQSYHPRKNGLIRP